MRVIKNINKNNSLHLPIVGSVCYKKSKNSNSLDFPLLQIQTLDMHTRKRNDAHVTLYSKNFLFMPTLEMSSMLNQMYKRCNDSRIYF